MPISVIAHFKRGLFVSVLILGSFISVGSASAQASESVSTPSDNQRLFCMIGPEEIAHLIFLVKGTWADLYSKIACQPGQRVFIYNSSWDFTSDGNLALLVRTCDMRYPIIRNKGSAACIYSPVDGFQGIDGIAPPK